MKSDITLATKIESVTLDVKEIDDVVHRMVAIKFARDFDDTLAAALGGDAKQILASLKRHGQEKAYISIDRMVVKARLTNPDGETIDIPSMSGRQAVCTASTSEQDPPTVRLEFVCFYADDAWLFLGKNAKGVCELHMAPKQAQLVGMDRSEAAAPNPEAEKLEFGEPAAVPSRRRAAHG